MNVLNKLIVSTIPVVPRPLVRQFASRYIAGETVEDAVHTVKRLNGQGAMATLDVLGEDITERTEATHARDAILDVLDNIRLNNLDSNISVKPTQLGLALDTSFCLDNFRTILEKAKAKNDFIRIDMEDSSTTDKTIWLYRELRKDFQNVGIVLQAYLRRTMDDAKSLMADGLNNFRLCKGIYIEAEKIAYKGHGEINDNYKAVLETMFDRKAYVGIATHDDKLVDAAYESIKRRKLAKNEYEFQMLLGVRPELRAQSLRNGHRVRIYVPFGQQWYRYSIRRFKENPQIAGYVFKALFTRNDGN